VRRTHLCGVDRRSRKDYSHRKQWIRDRLEELAGIFGIDVLGFAVMSNHLHVVVRTRPDIVRQWSDTEVAQRWWRLFPQRREVDGRPSEPTEFELNAIRNDVQKLNTVRERLADISWLMRRVAEPIARRANREDEVTGRIFGRPIHGTAAAGGDGTCRLHGVCGPQPDPSETRRHAGNQSVYQSEGTRCRE